MTHLVTFYVSDFLIRTNYKEEVSDKPLVISSEIAGKTDCTPSTATFLSKLQFLLKVPLRAVSVFQSSYLGLSLRVHLTELKVTFFYFSSQAFNMRSLIVLTLVFIFALLVQEGKTWRRRRRRRCPYRNCAVSSWSAWTRCTHNCGGSGTQFRTRRKTQSEACGGSCPYTFRETRACNRHCPNGGTPRGAGCACRVGFSGTCCDGKKLSLSFFNTSITKLNESFAKKMHFFVSGCLKSCFHLNSFQY